MFPFFETTVVLTVPAACGALLIDDIDSAAPSCGSLARALCFVGTMTRFVGTMGVMALPDTFTWINTVFLLADIV